MCSYFCYFLKVHASAANDFWVRTKRGKQNYYKKRKQIRYLNIFYIVNVLTLLSADMKSAILLRVPSLTRVEERNFRLLHFPRLFCLVNGQLSMSLRRVKRSVICKFQCFWLFNINNGQFYLKCNFLHHRNPLPPLKDSAKCQLPRLRSHFFTKMLQPLQLFILNI